MLEKMWKAGRKRDRGIKERKKCSGGLKIRRKLFFRERYIFVCDKMPPPGYERVYHFGLNFLLPFRT
jgi:hypothetical protein